MRLLVFIGLCLISLLLSCSSANREEAPVSDRTENAIASPQVKEIDETEIAELVKNLGNGEWNVREQATKNLLGKGEIVLPLLQKHLTDVTDPETKDRLEKIIRDIRKGSFTEHASEAQIKFSWCGFQHKPIWSLFIDTKSRKFNLTNFKECGNDDISDDCTVSVTDEKMKEFIQSLFDEGFFDVNELGTKCEAWSIQIYVNGKLYERIKGTKTDFDAILTCCGENEKDLIDHLEWRRHYVE